MDRRDEPVYTPTVCPGSKPSTEAMYNVLSLTLLIAKIVFCSPKGMGVSRAHSTIRKLDGPEMTLKIIAAVSFVTSGRSVVCPNRFNELWAILSPIAAPHTLRINPVNIPKR
uniref:Uncharacterized protein n=1 Tax=Photinus pyralis TaxID=7054 RepID=A0A1Y1KSQ4_PHOPY